MKRGRARWLWHDELFLLSHCGLYSSMWKAMAFSIIEWFHPCYQLCVATWYDFLFISSGLWDSTLLHHVGLFFISFGIEIKYRKWHLISACFLNNIVFPCHPLWIVNIKWLMRKSDRWNQERENKMAFTLPDSFFFSSIIDAISQCDKKTLITF